MKQAAAGGDEHGERASEADSAVKFSKRGGFHGVRTEERKNGQEGPERVTNVATRFRPWSDDGLPAVFDAGEDGATVAREEGALVQAAGVVDDVVGGGVGFVG